MAPPKPSLQKKLDRVRKPRVQIKYEVFTDGAMEMRELPFVVGVLGDFSGNPEKPLPKLMEREFDSVDRDTFDKLMVKTAPRLKFKVKDTVTGKEDAELDIELKFRSLDDFSPERVVEQIKPLRELYEKRNLLKGLLIKAETEDRRQELLEEILKNADRRDELAGELGSAAPPKSE